MAKIAIILVVVGLTVMASAYRMRPPHFHQGRRLQSEKLQDERAQFIQQLQGNNQENGNYLELYTLVNYNYNPLYTLALSADVEEEDVADVSILIYLYETTKMCSKNQHWDPDNSKWMFMADYNMIFVQSTACMIFTWSVHHCRWVVA